MIEHIEGESEKMIINKKFFIIDGAGFIVTSLIKWLITRSKYHRLRQLL